MFTLVKVSTITLMTTTPQSDMLVLALATLGGITDIASFLFVVTPPKVPNASTTVTVMLLLHDCHVSLSLTVSLTNFANVNNPLCVYQALYGYKACKRFGREDYKRCRKL